ncbi:helix-turn-helix domain-containing protein [Bradyrhizobium sp. USDA 3650]
MRKSRHWLNRRQPSIHFSEMVSRDSRCGIPEAREVHLSRKDRKVLEACWRSAEMLQFDLKRARIVLLPAEGRSTRSIAKEVRVHPRIVSLWRRRYSDHGVEGLQDKLPHKGSHPGRVLCWPRRWTMLTSNMSGGSCAATRPTSQLASPGATTRTLPQKALISSASTSRRPRWSPYYASTRSPRSRPWSERRPI